MRKWEGLNSEFYTSGHARHAGQGYNWAQIYLSNAFSFRPFFLFPCCFNRETDYFTRETYLMRSLTDFLIVFRQLSRHVKRKT